MRDCDPGSQNLGPDPGVPDEDGEPAAAQRGAGEEGGAAQGVPAEIQQVPQNKDTAITQGWAEFVENDSKRSRAVKKACDAREMARQKDRDMERLGEEIAVLEAKKERLQRKVEKNAIFWKYLEKVSKKSEKLSSFLLIFLNEAGRQAGSYFKGSPSARRSQSRPAG
ncbi:UNVERIFIED_CONTAM: hypothetical protein FKN15_033602 [Acipenser sinensis]